MASETTAERDPEKQVVGWARVYPTFDQSISKALRRGAWYPVVDTSKPDRISILMGTRPVEVPRRLLEFRKQRPKHFSVIDRIGYTPPDRQRKSLYNLGKRYAVCPVCSKRQSLLGHPDEKKCSRCGHTGEVGWWEA